MAVGKGCTLNSDAYIFFTGCHRLYVQGTRRAFRERLVSAFGEDWWEKGVEHAVTADQLNNLRSEIERNPDRERHVLLDAPHFTWIIAKHHNAIFSDAFPNAISTFRDLRRLVGLRNEWAHIQDISLVRARQAADVMKHILASLDCEEALEVERMSQDLVFEHSNTAAGDSIEDVDHSDDGFDSQHATIEPSDFWRQLQSYLVVEKTVTLPDQPNGEARVLLKVHNTAPDSRDWPAVHFKSVIIKSLGGREEHLGMLHPGETSEVGFTFPAKQLVTVEFEVVGKIDADQLFHFSRTTNLPQEVIAPLQQEFADQMESIAIKAFVNEVLDAIDAPDPNMTLTDIARIRDSLKLQSERIEEKLTALKGLSREFRLDTQSRLGSRTNEVALTLVDFRGKLNALDEAISRTDLESMNEAVHDLKQVQLAVLRVEGTIKTMTDSS